MNEFYNYKGFDYKIETGSRGGHYITVNNKKIYVKISKKKTSSETKNIRKNTTKSITRTKETRWDSFRSSLHTSLTKKKYCCCCGKELNESDCNYFDLEDYCPRCALQDGIITSLE